MCVCIYKLAFPILRPAASFATGGRRDCRFVDLPIIWDAVRFRPVQLGIADPNILSVA